MYCKKCGTELKEGQRFCPKCGTPCTIIKREEKPPLFSEIKEESSYFPKILAVTIILIALVGIGFWYWNKPSFDEVVEVLNFKKYRPDSDIDGVPFKSSENGKWGMLRPDGSILFEEEFKDEPTVAHDGRFYVRNGNGLWEIFTAEENPVKVGDEYVSLGEYYDGVAPAVRKNEKISLIDKKGNIIAVLDKSGSKPITKMTNFHYGYALFKAGDATGIVNTNGKILLEAKKYCKIYHIAPTRFLALDIKYKDDVDEHNYIYDIIDPSGYPRGTIKMAKYNQIYVLDDGYIGIEQTSDGEKLFGIMNLSGEIIVKPTNQIKGLYGYKDGKIIFSNGEHYGIRTIEDKVLIRAKYDAIRWAASDAIWAISVNDGRREASLVDLKGNKITTDIYIDALPFYDGEHAFVQITDNTWGMINYKGEELKNTPDIYAIEHNTADIEIISDYVDIDAVISSVNMTPYGFGGFGINMRAIDLVRNYNENCKNGEQLEVDPSLIHVDKLAYEKEIINGIYLNANLYYQAYITEQDKGYYSENTGEWIKEQDTWTKEAPKYIKMTISGKKLAGKTHLIYRKLVVKAKTYGRTYKENDRACIIIKKDGRGLVLVDTSDEVWGMVMNLDDLIGENIERYSENKTIVSQDAILQNYQTVSSYRTEDYESGNFDSRQESPRSDGTRVFDVVEEMPQFPGGPSSLFEYLARNVKYPVVAEENGVQGRVIVTFVVERDGSLNEVKVVKSIDPSLDKEAQRVVRSMPHWIPGKQNGAPVRVKYTVPVTFRLQ